jgi:hypothetical protein
VDAVNATGSRTDARRQRVSILILLVGAWTVIPRTLQTVTAPKYRNSVVLENPPYTASAALSLKVLTVGLLAFCLVVVLEAIRDRPRRGVGAFVLLVLPWLYLEVRDWTLGARLPWSGLVYPAVVMAIWVLRPALRQLVLLGYVVGAVALVSIAIGFMLPAQGIFRHADGTVVSPEKAVLPGGILVGIFTHGNNLGQFLVLGLPMVALIRHRATRNVLLVACLFALVWSAARSAMVAVLVLVLLTAAVAVVPPARRGLPARLMIATCYLVMAVVPFMTTDPLAFSNRGYVWLESLAAWRTNPLFGLGSHYYSDIAVTSQTLGPTVFHGHNQLVHLLVTGGILLGVLVLILLLSSISFAVGWAKKGSLLPVAFLIALAGVCIFEVSMVFVDNVFLLPVMVVPLAFLMFAHGIDVSDSTADRSSAGAAVRTRVTSGLSLSVDPNRG